MNTFVLILIVLAFVALLLSWLISSRKRVSSTAPAIPVSYRQILFEQVDFYKALNQLQKQEFENRIQLFLEKVSITGVKTLVEEQDKVLIAASAVIPIFGFPEWEYINLKEVLLYPDSFNHDFEQSGNDRSILGMVGDGAYNNIMILSQHELRQAFLNKTGKSNTAIHEFVHLVDKTDGSVDGIPEYLLHRKYVLPWLQLMHQEMKKILADRSDINPYGATNEAEFFAVVSEYFFERPALFKQKNSELYELLSTIFRQQPVS